MADYTKDFGLLVSEHDIKLHRKWFKQMTKLHGINCTYRALKKSSEWDSHGELEGKYFPPVKVGCILQDHPDQKTMKKMGWIAELQEGSLVLHVPYDLENLQAGCLFDLPAAVDGGKPRTFRVISMSTIMVYPASIACEIALEYEDSEEKSDTRDFTHDTITMLRDNEEDD